jgi:hypothetical protein
MKDTIMKTDGNGNEFPVENPDKFAYDENGRRRTLKKRNRSQTNLTPPKKKRKKR